MAWTLPHSGELRFKFRFDRPATAGAGSTLNVGGVIGGASPATAWNNLIPTRSAKLEAVRGGLEVISDRLSGKAVFDLWVRYDSLTSTLQAGDRGVDIQSNISYALGLPIDPNFRKQWLLIQATTDGRAV